MCLCLEKKGLPGVFVCIKHKFKAWENNKELQLNETWHKTKIKIKGQMRPNELRFVFDCLFGVSRPTREFFTHMETSQLPVKGCKFWPMPGTHGHWAVRVLLRATPTAILVPFIRIISEDPWHSQMLPSVWKGSCHYLFLRLRSVATGDRTRISRMRGARSTSTPLRRYEIR